MQCIQCRKNIAPDNNFCTACGTAVQDAGQPLVNVDVGAATNDGQTLSSEPQSLEEKVNAKLAALEQTSASMPGTARNVPDNIGSVQGLPPVIESSQGAPTAGSFQQSGTSPLGAFPQSASSASPFQSPVHQPKKKGLPTWGIVAIVVGVLLLIAACCIVPAVLVFQELEQDLQGQSTFGDPGILGGSSLQEIDVEDILADVDIDPAVLEVIVGEYEEIVSYEGDNADTARRTEHNGRGEYYTFNADLTFTIAEADRRDHPWDEGVFSVTQIDFDNLSNYVNSFDRSFMLFVDDRATSDWYHLTLFHVWDSEVLYENNLIMSIADPDDIIIYQTTFGQTSVVERTTP
ncbi:MAG: zinc ribbon domain-containing protein [Coriobacteriia bacterium]|nr:zinc ribbon domain-containing protein [Coriobacteriia bacterium]